MEGIQALLKCPTVSLQVLVGQAQTRPQRPSTALLATKASPDAATLRGMVCFYLDHVQLEPSS